jgi:hypothetical protein
MTEHSYEEIYQVALDLLAGRETPRYQADQFLHFRMGIAEVFNRRELAARGVTQIPPGNPPENQHDADLCQEVFWDLFRQGIIVLGSANVNDAFPFFRVSSYGKRFLEQNQNPYFFHDISSYERIIRENIPDIDEVTLLYLKEAMQAFTSGCMLSSSVMLGVAAEHSFEKLLEIIEGNPRYETVYRSAISERFILRKLNKFKQILDQHIGEYDPEIREDLDTNFSGIIAIIRNFRNESGHPSGKIISREQCYILLQLFIPYCKKIYQLKQFFERNE